MRHRSRSSDHAEAVSRRLATLSAELAAVRGDPLPPSSGAGGEPSEPPTRVRARPGPVGPDGTPPEPVPSGSTPAVAVAVPTPGRHASRRLADRVALAPSHLAVLALFAAVGLAVAAWLVVRSDAEPAPLPVVEQAPEQLIPAAGGAPGEGAGTPQAGSSPDSTPSGPADTGAEGEQVTVDVAGEVRRPGIAVLPAGSRVVDALDAAGGARRGVDLTALNLARPLVDGEQVLVGVAAPTVAGASVGEPATVGSGPLVDLNSADQATLETLPGVGPVTAQAIIGWRTEHGGFTSVEELLEVDGIGDATLAEIAPHATL